MGGLYWTARDLELMPDGKRHEIVDGQLYKSKEPDLQHQTVCSKIAALLERWNEQTGKGLTIFNPGVIFTNLNAVIPDVVWISHELLATAQQADGKLHSCPELVVEVLSPSPENQFRYRKLKLKLYSDWHAQEYWIVDWQERTLEVYRCEDAELKLVKTLDETDVLDTPLLPGFSCKVSDLFTSAL